MSTYDQSNSTHDPLAGMVDEIVREEISDLQQRRSAHRLPLVRPVSIEIDGDEPLFGFSKNISENGIGLIMQTPPQGGASARIIIQRLKGNPLVIRSELRWCEPFGSDWFITGWKFLAEVRS